MLIDSFKTQPPIQFHTVVIILHNDNHPVPPVIRSLSFEVAPYSFMLMVPTAPGSEINLSTTKHS